MNDMTRKQVPERRCQPYYYLYGGAAIEGMEALKIENCRLSVDSRLLRRACDFKLHVNQGLSRLIARTISQVRIDVLERWSVDEQDTGSAFVIVTCKWRSGHQEYKSVVLNPRYRRASLERYISSHFAGVAYEARTLR